MDKDKIKENIKALLQLVGEDETREGLLNTPERVAKSYEFLLKGYQQKPEEVVNSALFSAEYNEMVIVRDIDFYSLCEHHMLPFYGKAHVAYIPNEKVIGLSKIPRLIEVFSRRLQIQERLTTQVAETLEQLLVPKGVAVVIEAFHFCMAMRGVEKQNSYTTTSAMLGVFRENKPTRMEFMSLLKKHL